MGAPLALFFVVLGGAEAGSPPPFTLDLGGVGASGYTVTATTLATGLNYPYGMAMSQDGSIVFGQSLPLTGGGIEGGPSTGSVWMLPKQADGTFGAPRLLIDNLVGPVTDVRARGGLMLVDSGAASGRTMSLYNQSSQQIGLLGFNYPTVDWDHSTGMSLLVPGSGGAQRIYFIIGSEFDQDATIAQLSTSGLFHAALNPDSVYYVDVSVNGNSLTVLGPPQQVAKGLRNPYGLTLDASGNLIIGDNGQDGAHLVNEVGADTLDVVPAARIGTVIYDFGFPNSYTDFATGQRVNGDPGATAPLVSFVPVPNAAGTLQYPEGLAGMAYAPPGSMPFVGSLGGEVVAFDGTKDAAGAANFDDALLYYDFASGKYSAIVDSGSAGAGHLDTVLVSGNSLFVADFSSAGIVDDVGGTGSGAIYEFTFNAAASSITSLSPNSASAGGSSFTLTVNGSGFLPGAAELWNGSALVTTVVSATQLTAGVPAALIASQGSASVTVLGTGAISNALTFTINAPASLTIVTASPLASGATGVTYSEMLTATGGVAPYTWTVAAGSSLPAGISLIQGRASAVWMLSGTPASGGTFTFTLQVTDSINAFAARQFSLTITGAAATLSANGIVNAASYAGGKVSPGEIVTIFGSFPGPAKRIDLQLDSRGFVASNLGGEQVLFDGTPAPMIYAEAGQISAVVPYEVSGESSTQVQVSYQGHLSNSVAVPVAGAVPGVFTIDASGSGPGSIVNQNQTVNAANNPAAIGSIVSVYATGEGQTNPAGVDGMPDPGSAAAADHATSDGDGGRSRRRRELCGRSLRVGRGSAASQRGNSARSNAGQRGSDHDQDWRREQPSQCHAGDSVSGPQPGVVASALTSGPAQRTRASGRRSCPACEKLASRSRVTMPAVAITGHPPCTPSSGVTESRKYQPQDAGRIDSGGDVEGEVPIVAGPLEDIADHHGRHGSADVAPGIHRARKRAGVFAAEVHGGGPGVRHGQVTEEARHGDGQHGEERVGDQGGQHQRGACAGESGAGEDAAGAGDIMDAAVDALA